MADRRAATRSRERVVIFALAAALGLAPVLLLSVEPPPPMTAKIFSASPGPSARGVWRLMPSVPLSWDIPFPDSNLIVLRREVRSATGTTFGAATHALLFLSNFGDSRIAR